MDTAPRPSQGHYASPPMHRDAPPSPSPSLSPRPTVSPPAAAFLSSAPRLGLAFILNDPPPRDDAANSTSRLLPQAQWPSPAKHLDHRDARERRPMSMASLVWPEIEPNASARWRDASLPHERRRVEATHACIQNDQSVAEKPDARATRLVAASPPVAAPLSRQEKRRGRTCRIDGCDNYIVHKGLCCRHGGARKCSTEGCNCTAKYMGLCWKHGGSTWCKMDGCSKRAKAKGKCWAHGGGTACSHAKCTKVAVSNGLCWAHGGGKRCHFDGCNRPGYERTNGFCDRHFDEVQHVNYFEL